MDSVEKERYPDPHHDIYSKTIFGFWLYLLTDLILFATLFATYAVLRNALFGGKHPSELFDLSYTFFQTILLLFSGYTAGIGGVYVHRKEKGKAFLFFLITFLLGAWFLGLECGEFSRLISGGDSWEKSAYLSAFFTLVGTHAAHVVFALLWTIVLLVPMIKRPIEETDIRRLSCLRMFWQFLNVVWVFIFTFVYLMGEVH